jgi:hypothetical protein
VRDGMKPSVFRAHVAQLVEHVLGKDEVTRSIRVVGSIPCLTRPGARMIVLGDRIDTAAEVCSSTRSHNDCLGDGRNAFSDEAQS